MTALDDEDSGTFASPPCLMHELDPTYLGTPDATDPRQSRDVARWRKAERQRLIDDRLAIPTGRRRRYDARITQYLAAAIGRTEGRMFGAYLPIGGEPDLRPLWMEIVARGGRCALPIVTARDRPLVFRPWRPDGRLADVARDAPDPLGSEAIAVPDVVFAPVVGFDPGCHRLGYGDGSYDRTLAELPDVCRVFGVGYAQAAMSTVYPQWHDIPLSAVVTQDGVITPASVVLSGHEC